MDNLVPGVPHRRPHPSPAGQAHSLQVPPMHQLPSQEKKGQHPNELNSSLQTDRRQCTLSGSSPASLWRSAREPVPTTPSHVRGHHKQGTCSRWAGRCRREPGPSPASQESFPDGGLTPNSVLPGTRSGHRALEQQRWAEGPAGHAPSMSLCRPHTLWHASCTEG